VLLAAQQGEFMGGGVGEVHGAKLTGLLRRAAETRPEGVLLLLDTGGVRLHEANAGSSPFPRSCAPPWTRVQRACR
jgi:malonate decarboxylase beta subunit